MCLCDYLGYEEGGTNNLYRHVSESAEIFKKVHLIKPRSLLALLTTAEHTTFSHAHQRALADFLKHSNRTLISGTVWHILSRENIDYHNS